MLVSRMHNGRLRVLSLCNRRRISRYCILWIRKRTLYDAKCILVYQGYDYAYFMNQICICIFWTKNREGVPHTHAPPFQFHKPDLNLPTPDSIQISNCLSLSPSLINPTMALAAGELYFAFGFSLIFCCVLPRSRHSPPTKLVRHSISMGQGLCVGVLQNFGWIFKFPFQERICEYTCSICLLPSLLRVHLV